VFGCVCAGAAVFTALVGAVRYFRMQGALVEDGLGKGTVGVGGWDVVALAGIGGLVSGVIPLGFELGGKGL
jgi:hypothetical protein